MLALTLHLDFPNQLPLFFAFYGHRFVGISCFACVLRFNFGTLSICWVSTPEIKTGNPSTVALPEGSESNFSEVFEFSKIEHESSSSILGRVRVAQKFQENSKILRKFERFVKNQEFRENSRVPRKFEFQENSSFKKPRKFRKKSMFVKIRKYSKISIKFNSRQKMLC